MKKILAIAFLAAIVLQGAAYAEEVSGKVVNADAAANTLKIAKSNAEGAQEEVTISVKPETTFSGAASLAELKAGQEVSIDAAQDAATGTWQANSVKVAAAAPAAQ